MKTILLEGFIYKPVKLWLAFTLTSAFLFSQPLVSQNIVVEPSDNEILAECLSECTGSLQLQTSSLGEDWNDIEDGTTDALQLKSANNLYHSGNLTIPGCLEYYTEEVQILAESLDTRRMVVAHYMVGMSMYKDNEETTVAGLKKDITDAHEQGVDAFQINIFRFDSASRNIVAMFFQAASECVFSFYLFLSADYNRRITNPMRYDEILDFMSLYANHPNHLMVNGRPLFTTWLGSQEGADYWKTIKQELYEEHDIDIFYVPWYGIYFNYRGDKIKK